MKQHKTQILAALALAFCLGMVAPSTTFAAEGTSTAAVQPSTTPSQVTGTELYALITVATNNSQFNKYQNLVTAQQNLEADLDGASAATLTAARNAVTALDANAKVADLNAKDLNNYIKGMKEFKEWSGIIAELNAIAKDAKVSSISNITAASMANLSAAQISSHYDILDALITPASDSYADNIVRLNMRIVSRSTFDGYRKAVDTIVAAEALAPYTANAEDYLSEIPPMATTSVWQALSLDTQNALRGRTGYEALVEIKGTADYAGEVRTAVDAALSTMNTNVAALKTQLADVEGVANMNVGQLVAEAQKIENYAKYRNLYNSLGFIRAVTSGGADLSAEALNAAYTNAVLASDYSNMLTAARAIDASIGNGLLMMPETSAPDDKNDEDNKSDVEAPNTGIIGLFESGALDLGTITLIVSVAVAGLAGVGLIAKLYLKHKF